jgi:hypothetical protein
MLTRPTIVDRPWRTRAAVSNGTRMHAKGVDGRSAEARRFKDLVSSFAASLGGEGALMEAERALIRNAALLTLQNERLQVAFVAGREVNSEELTRLANLSARVLAALRIKHERNARRPRQRFPNILPPRVRVVRRDEYSRSPRRRKPVRTALQWAVLGAVAKPFLPCSPGQADRGSPS